MYLLIKLMIQFIINNKYKKINEQNLIIRQILCIFVFFYYFSKLFLLELSNLKNFKILIINYQLLYLQNLMKKVYGSNLKQIQ